jgi:four helix bundle protein
MPLLLGPDLNQRSKLKMQNDKSKFKEEFKGRLYTLAFQAIKFVGGLDLKDPTCRVIADQLTRSATSILANCIEGQAASSRREYINFFNHSLKSSNESRVWVALLRDSEKCNHLEAGRI